VPGGSNLPTILTLRERVSSDESSQRFEIQVVCEQVRSAACSDGEPMIVTLPILATLFSLTIVTAQDVVPVRTLPLVRIVGTNIELHSSGITANSCIAIRSDGRFHLETRLQQLPHAQAVLHIYEATLDAFQLSRLESMLDAQAVREASSYKGPKLPMVVSTVANVRMDIARADRVQTVGYLAWNQEPGTDGLSPESTPEALKEEWRSSRLALTPLMGWLHEVEAMRWPELDESHSTLCGDPSTAN
jgi:hypothetical protein